VCPPPVSSTNHLLIAWARALNSLLFTCRPVAAKLIPKPRPVSVPVPARTQQTVARGSAVPVHAHNGPVAKAPAPPVPAGGAHFNAHRPAAKAPAPPPAPGPATVLPARTEPVSRPPGPRYVVATQGSVVWGDAFGAAGQHQAGVSPMEEDVQQRDRMHHHTPAWSVHMNHVGGHGVMDGMNGGHGMHGGRVASPPIVAPPGDYSSHFASPQPPQQAPLPLLPSSPFMPTPQPPQPPMGAPFVGLPAVLFPQASYPPPFQQHGGDGNGWMPQQQMAPPPFMGQQHFGGAPMAYATQYMQHQHNTLMF
jgi:hypothetical protein